MPRRRNAILAERDERFQQEAAAQRKASTESLTPRTATINLDELQIPEGGELPPRIAQAVALRVLGLSSSEIGEKLNLSKRTVDQYLYMARMRGKLTDVGPILDHAVVPMAVENLIAGLEQGDKEYTLEVLKGRGAFRSHSANVSSGSTGPMHLQIQVELPKGSSGAVIDVGPGQVMGVPRE